MSEIKMATKYYEASKKSEVIREKDADVA